MKVEMPSIEEVSSASSCNELSDDVSITSCNNRQDFIGELVGATDLVVDDDDVGVVRPYAEVYFGKNKIHYSEPSEGLSPIWTIDTDSLFLLKATPLELTSNVLTIKILTSRSISPLTEIKSFLGQASLKPEDFLKLCNGDRFELNVQDELCDDTSCRGKLALRLRLATPADVRFVTLWNGRRLKENTIVKALLHHEDTYKDKQKAILVSETNESKAAGDSFRNAINSALDFSSFFESQRGGEQRKKIKPFPDPSRPKSTRFLTPHEIKVETRRPSENWVQAGSGTLGKLYVEILACHGLPNVDVGEAIGNVTDSFVALVFEDALAETPVIDDELSPHWLPWTQRAFCFGVMHPASTLYVGVFDYDIGPLANHEPLGRVAVNISNLQRDTLYTLRYNLFKSANVTDRTPIGQITMRVRVEIFDEKLSLLAALKPRPNIHVNVKKKKSFKVVRYVCFGEYDGEDKFDLTVTRSYINEIFEYKSHLSYAIRDSLESLMFWRGQVEVFSVLLPIHSMIFFFSTSTLVERPCLFPAFAILSVAWLMIANGRRRHQHPSPWCRCHTFLHYLGILINGKSSISFQRIKAYEGRDEAIACEEAWKKREEEDTKRAEKRADLERELQEHGDENIHTQVQMGIPLDLLERLGRYQGYIGSICRFFRQLKIILMWEESILSFWITAIFLAVGLISLLLPWGFILTWTGRLIVYGLFGPQMKIVDLWLRMNKADEFQRIMEAFDAKKKVARIRREQALKVRALKCLRFGKLITQVPAFNLARHYDRPLPVSTAKLLRKVPTIDCATYIPGQQLYGDIIPRLQNHFEKNFQDSLNSMEKLAKLYTRLVLIQAAGKFKRGLQRCRLLRLKERILADDGAPDEIGYEVRPRRGGSESKLLAISAVTAFASPQASIKASACFDISDIDLCGADNERQLDLETHSCSQSCISMQGSSISVHSMDELTDEEDDSISDRGLLKLPESRRCTKAGITGQVSSFKESCWKDNDVDEMGIEVVKCDDDNYCSEEGIEVVDWGKEEISGGIPRESQSGLSAIYRESDFTFLTFCRM